MSAAGRRQGGGQRRWLGLASLALALGIAAIGVIALSPEPAPIPQDADLTDEDEDPAETGGSEGSAVRRVAREAEGDAGPDEGSDAGLALPTALPRLATAVAEPRDFGALYTTGRLATEDGVAAVSKVMPHAMLCQMRLRAIAPVEQRRWQLRLTVRPEGGQGRITDVAVVGKGAIPAPLLDCIREAAKKATVPLRAGGGTVVAPLTLAPRLGKDGEYDFDTPGGDTEELDDDDEPEHGDHDHDDSQHDDDQHDDDQHDDEPPNP